MQWCNVDQLALPFIESGYIQTCLVKSFARLHPPCWALISTFDEAHMQHAKEAEAAADTGNLDAHISKVAAEVRRCGGMNGAPGLKVAIRQAWGAWLVGLGRRASWQKAARCAAGMAGGRPLAPPPGC